MEQSLDFVAQRNNGQGCRLCKIVYSLKQSLRAWQNCRHGTKRERPNEDSTSVVGQQKKNNGYQYHEPTHVELTSWDLCHL